MSEQITPKHGILQYWPTLVTLVTIVFSLGVIYAKFDAMGKRQEDLDGRYTRQFTIINEVGARVTTLEKKEAFDEGYKQAIKDLQTHK